MKPPQGLQNERAKLARSFFLREEKMDNSSPSRRECKISRAFLFADSAKRARSGVSFHRKGGLKLATKFDLMQKETERSKHKTNPDQLRRNARKTFLDRGAVVITSRIYSFFYEEIHAILL